jgi:hypothetical protein
MLQVKDCDDGVRESPERVMADVWMGGSVGVFLEVKTGDLRRYLQADPSVGWNAQR